MRVGQSYRIKKVEVPFLNDQQSSVDPFAELVLFFFVRVLPDFLDEVIQVLLERERLQVVVGSFLQRRGLKGLGFELLVRGLRWTFFFS